MRHNLNRPSATRASLIAAASLLLTVLLLTVVAPSAQAETCPNEARRSEQGAPGLALPDCRAYELVSPSGLEPLKSDTTGFQASLSGDRAAFYSQLPPAPGSQWGVHYLATRGASGWSSRDMIPPQSVEQEKWCFPSIVYSPDLAKSVLYDGWNWGEGYPTYPDSIYPDECGHDAPLLVPGEPLGAQNLFLHDSGDPAAAGFYQLLNLTPPNLAARNAYFQAASGDFSHIVFSSAAQLTPEAPPPGPLPIQATNSVAEDLYENAGGVVRLVTLLPGGEPVWGLLANANVSDNRVGAAAFTNAVSDDGERVFFYAGGELSATESVWHFVGGSLYLRLNAGQPPVEECAGPGSACTVQLDAAQGGPESGGGRFQWASGDGSKAFFTDERKLTEDSKAQTGKPDLYEYDLQRPAGERLADLTADAPEPADVLGLSGISGDGSYVYFVAKGLLSGEQANSQGDKAQAGKANLYLRHAGATTFIAALELPTSELLLERGDACDWASSIIPIGGPAACMSARVSPDGAFLAFNSLERLTGYDNTVVEPNEPGERDNEIFLYEAAADTLSCASCDPSGAPPTASFFASDPRVQPPMSAKNGKPTYQTPGYLTRSLSEDGADFFDTTNRLLSGDLNDKSDVYEYKGGNLHLISTGTSPDPASFRDASASGDDVFFLTTQPFARSDTDKALSLYDARVNGGFPEPPPPVVCESEEACHTAHQQPPASSTSGTSHFEGPEEGPNHPRCPKGQVKRHGKCVKPHRHRKAKHHKRHAHTNRRTGK
jgi:hypothetical protein